jgi:predicted DNA binding CopG/RHH family protein
MAKKSLLIPSFQSEAQEAQWWDRHRRDVEAQLRRHLRRGSTHTLAEVMEGLEKKESLRPVTIRMRSDDIVTARGLAARKGIGYQTYIKLLLREALEREASKHRRG